jgi:ABC-2 type transport system ATP-binding protein
VTIVVATAYLDEAERCHRVALVHDGRLLACAPPAELQGLMRGTILEVRTPAVRQAVRLLREGTAALAVGRFGERLHVVTDDPAQLTKDIVLVMAQAGLAVDGIRPIEPSLEDVLVSVLANRETPP